MSQSDLSVTSAIHPMRIVSARTGLSPHVIRAWERRYQAVVPQRTPGNRRLYTQTDINRLLLLRHAVNRGYSIGQLAALSLAELREIDIPSPAHSSLGGAGDSKITTNWTMETPSRPYLEQGSGGAGRTRTDGAEALGDPGIYEGRSPQRRLSWADILEAVIRLSRQIQKSEFYPQQIVAVGRSGAIIGGIIAADFASAGSDIAVHVFDDHLSGRSVQHEHALNAGPALLVIDEARGGSSFQKARAWLDQRGVTASRTLALARRPGGDADYFCFEAENSEFPWQSAFDRVPVLNPLAF